MIAGKLKSVFVLGSLLLASQFLWAQPEPRLRVGDFDGDGATDSLSCIYDGGSGFGGWDCTLRDGASGEKFELYNGGCFCTIHDLYLIPKRLLKPENEIFWDSLRSNLFPEISQTLSPVAGFLLSARQNSRKFPEESPFELLISPKVDWTAGELPAPRPEAIWLNEVEAALMDSEDWGMEEVEDREDAGKLWVINGRAIDYGWPAPAAPLSVGPYQLIPHQHGVRLRKGKQEKWLFITDFSLTGGVDKMRWTSIQELRKIDKNLVLLRLNRAVAMLDGVFVLHFPSGKMLELKGGVYSGKQLKLEEDSVLMEGYDGEDDVRVSLQEIRNAFQPR